MCNCLGSLRHILSGCRKALAQGRYRWCHDQVLEELAHILEKERRKDGPKQYIGFVRGDKSSEAPTTESTGILLESGSWDMKVDLKKLLQFPEEIAHTILLPDTVIRSRSPK